MDVLKFIVNALFLIAAVIEFSYFTEFESDLCEIYIKFSLRNVIQHYKYRQVNINREFSANNC